MARRRRLQVTTGSTAAFGAGLALLAASLYAIGWAVDYGVRHPAPMPWDLALSPAGLAALANMAEVAVGVLGVAITVVAIIVELAATRYTPRITELFLRDRTNVVVLSCFVLTSVLTIWVGVTVDEDQPPRVLVLVLLAAVSLAMLSLLPYFAYVFDFLSPASIVRRIGDKARAAMLWGARGGSVERSQQGALTALDQLGDVARRAVESKDQAIATDAVAQLAELMVEHLSTREDLPDAWFDAEPLLRQDPDFVAFHRDVIRRQTPRRTWLLMKALRQYEAIVVACLHEMRDVVHLAAIHTRRFAVKAAEVGDADAFVLSIRFMNTYLRAAINARDVRAAYNLFNEYRLLGEGLLGTPLQGDLLRAAGHIKGYGQIAFRQRLPFLLETAAYDLCTLLERVHDAEAPERGALLDLFLDVDREPEDNDAQEASLRGVRKAQIKLATWLLARGEVSLARRIFEDMRDEPPARLASIRAELEATTEAEYWEISDRGVNFDWLDPGRRAVLPRFFGWFRGVTDPG